jgi:glycosyltransferase involved in cell wall biosynthesis
MQIEKESKLTDNPSLSKIKGRVYFDITPAIRHIILEGNVTGIQRVEINIALQMAKNISNSYISFFNKELEKHQCCPAYSITEEYPPTRELILSKFGALESGFFPRKWAMKAILNRSQKRGLSRAIFKFYILLLTVFNRKEYHSHFPKPVCEKIPLESVSDFSAEDIVYVIGNVITAPDLIEPLRKLKKKGGIVIQTIHDIIPLTQPNLVPSDAIFNFKNWIAKLPYYANNLVCVSDYTKKEFTKFFDQSNFSSITTIPLAHEFIGYSRPSGPKNSPSKIISPGERYILCVGTIEIRKNGANLLKAWKKVIEEFGGDTPHLVFAGKLGWHLESFYEVLNSDKLLKSFIRIIDKPTDDAIAKLYRNCMFTIFPSQYEGWGLPIGESLWFGKACISSNVTSMPEVGQDLVCYINPHDVDQIAVAVIDLLSNENKIYEWEEKISSSKLRIWSDVSKDISKLIVGIDQCR